MPAQPQFTSPNRRCLDGAQCRADHSASRSEARTPHAQAPRALTRRAYSVHEMRKWLEQRAESRGLADAVLMRLKERGYVDDARYAKQYARQRVVGRRLGRFRVAQDLRARGVPDKHSDAALDEVRTKGRQL